MIEIERKFLVRTDQFLEEASHKVYLVQGFLSSHPNRTVRVRLKADTGALTVKGRSSLDGTTRFEWETQLTPEEAKALLDLCEPGIIEKTRYEVVVEEHVFEVDVFHGDNDGLILAEIELPSKETPFEKPAWLGKEVTGDIRYYNSQLSKHPFKSW